ncbi:MAG: arsenate reductase (glutaredoxin) [Caulobacteraceae bacterium]|nr:arsenate reductase (glutaredoxin) [Caulobacteraceae bacterium]
MDGIVIYHNPNCGTSRTTLAMLRERGHDPEVVEYLKAGWTRELLEDLFRRMGVHPRQALRVRGTAAHELGLTDPSASDGAILAAMVLDPVLVERPIVVTPRGAALCRPADLVLSLLEESS